MVLNSTVRKEDGVRMGCDGSNPSGVIDLILLLREEVVVINNGAYVLRCHLRSVHVRIELPVISLWAA